MKRFFTRVMAVTMGLGLILGAMAAYVIGTCLTFGVVAFIVAGAAKVAWGLF